MKTLVIYYSYTGKSREIAKKIAAERNAEIVEVKEVKNRSKFNAYMSGSMAAKGQKPANVQHINVHFYDYETIIIVAPIWAGYPAPAFNNITDLLTPNKKIELVMVSGSGNSSKSKSKTSALISGKVCQLSKYTDIKA